MILATLLISPSILYAENILSNKEKVFQMYRDYQKKFPDVTEIGPKEAILENINGTAVFIDVRKESERSVSTLPKAITKEAYLRDRDLYKDKKVIAYCTIGYRSGVFAKEMKEKGILVYNLSAGILGWTHEGGKVYDSRGIVQRIHVYGKDWNYPPEGFETTTFGLLERLIK